MSKQGSLRSTFVLAIDLLVERLEDRVLRILQEQEITLVRVLTSAGLKNCLQFDANGARNIHISLLISTARPV